MTSLEKRALYGLLIGVLWAVIFFTLFFTLGGVSTYGDKYAERNIMSVIVVAGSISYIIVYISYRKCAKADERDRLILIRASDIQLAATIFTVVGWCTALGLIYKSQGQISIGYLFLIVISMVIAGMIMQALGILFWSRNTEYLNKV